MENVSLSLLIYIHIQKDTVVKNPFLAKNVENVSLGLLIYIHIQKDIVVKNPFLVKNVKNGDDRVYNNT